ncbi:histidine kinase [Streptomyces sp. ActVer]|uniref:sensor histidine kinase n=1 Tax=Streptomyces sp. ActVer TaxID=3014558 RepID=UPI0022B48D98|nr:histidine kinase [Streptomyces sp. ActVer]MCZ4510116.1 histidine kinase [Streptomyces sp. ActVer]
MPEDTRRSPAAPTRGLTGAARRLRREVAEIRAQVRAVPRRTVVAESIVCALAAAFGLIPLLLIPPDRPVLAVLEALWAALLVAARRGRPVAAVLGAFPLLMGANVWVLAVVPLIVLSATRRIAPPRRAWRIVGVACAALGGLTVAAGLFRWETLPMMLAENTVSAVLLLLLPTLAGTMLGRRRPLVDLLRERNAYLEQTRTLTAAAARMEERTRIAREMHDLLGHRLSLISVHAGALELAAARQAPPLAGQVELLRTTAGTAMEELREILGVLRHTDLSDENGGDRGTYEDITALVTQSRQTGGGPVELVWSVPDTVEVGARVRQAIHRVVREGLTNVLKHASGAPVLVEVKGTDAGVEVYVTNGVPRVPGDSQGGTSSGLAGLQERISLLGGAFAAGALPDGGFRVTAWLPSQPSHATNGPVPTPSEAAAHAGAEHLPPASRPPSGDTWRPGSNPPLSAQTLTWPRVLGAGCTAVLVVLPTAGFLIVLLVMAALG